VRTILAILVLAACADKTCPPSSCPPPEQPPSDALPPGNVVQTEMRMLTQILEATVRGIGARDVRPIEQMLHKLHAAKEATTAAATGGSYKLPKNADSLAGFIAMDEAFHRHLGALVKASRANDVPRAADALGAIVRSCEGCHAVYRAD
jgi:cytochrome c556